MAFYELTDEELAEIEEKETRSGSAMTSETRALLDAFEALAVGKAFAMDVPEGKDAHNYRDNINATLARYEHKNRNVRVNPLDPHKLKVKKTAAKQSK